uniref:Uncharacterized protein n=1 Tax=Brassica oleracea TaxID=3712 RepID=A0A3P6CHE3_BRAOL|nr:unnamed protein product [Brassica oleracea]
MGSFDPEKIHAKPAFFLAASQAASVLHLFSKVRELRSFHIDQHIQGRMVFGTPDGGRQIVDLNLTTAASKVSSVAK